MAFPSFKQFREMAAFAHPGTDSVEVLNFHPLRNLLSKIPAQYQAEVMKWANEDAIYDADRVRNRFLKQANKTLHSLMKKADRNAEDDITSNTIYPEDLFTTDRLRDLAVKQWGVDPNALINSLKYLYHDMDQYEPKYIELSDGNVINLEKLNKQLTDEGKTPFKLNGENGLLRYREDSPLFKDPVVRDPHGRKVRATRGVSLANMKFGIDPATRKGVWAGRDYDSGTSDEAYTRAVNLARRGIGKDIAHHSKHGKPPYGDDADFDNLSKGSIEQHPDTGEGLVSWLGVRNDPVTVSQEAGKFYADKIAQEIEHQLNDPNAEGSSIGKPASVKYVPASFIVTDSSGQPVPPGSEGTPPYKVTYKGIADGPEETSNPFYYVDSGEVDEHGQPIRAVQIRPQIKVAGKTFQISGILGHATRLPIEGKGKIKGRKGAKEPFSARDAIAKGYENPRRVIPLKNPDYIEKGNYRTFPVDIAQLINNNWLPICPTCKGTGKAAIKKTDTANEAVNRTQCPTCQGKGILDLGELNKQSSINLTKGANQTIHLVKGGDGIWSIKSFDNSSKGLSPQELAAYKEAPLLSVNQATKYGAKTLKAFARLANKDLETKFQKDWLQNPEKWGEEGSLTDEKGNLNPSHTLAQAAYRAMKRGEMYGQSQDKNASSLDMLSSAYNRAAGFYNDSRFAYGDLNYPKQIISQLEGLGINPQEAQDWLQEFKAQQSSHDKPIMIESPNDLINQNLAQTGNFDKVLQLFRKNGANWRKRKFSSIAMADDVSKVSLDKEFGDEGGSLGGNIAGNTAGGTNKIGGGQSTDFQGMAGRITNKGDMDNFSNYNKLQHPGLLKHQVHGMSNYGPFAQNNQYKNDPNWASLYQKGKHLGLSILGKGDIQNIDEFQSLMPQDKNPIMQSAVLDAMGDSYLFMADDQAYEKAPEELQNDYYKFLSMLNHFGFDQQMLNGFIAELKNHAMNRELLPNPKDSVTATLRPQAQIQGVPAMLKSNIVDAISKRNHAAVANLINPHIKNGQVPLDLEPYVIFTFSPEVFEDKVDYLTTQLDDIYTLAKQRSTRERRQDVFLLPQEQRQIKTMMSTLMQWGKYIQESQKDPVLANLAHMYFNLLSTSMSGLQPELQKKVNDYMTVESLLNSGLITFKEYRMRQKALALFETDAIYDGSKPTTFNWWGAVGDPNGVSIEGEPIKPRKKKKNGK